MRRMVLSFMRLGAILVIVVFSACLCGHSDSNREDGPLIPTERRIDWSRAGVFENGVKGIPQRTTIFCNVRESIPGSALVARGDGIQDDTEALRAAINACPVGQVVFIPQGTYPISGTLEIRKSIVVRGEGPDKTKIIQRSGSHVFTIRGVASYVPNTVVNVTSGYSRGSDTVVVSNGSNFHVGDVVTIDQLNDPLLVTQTGEGTCTWCGRDGLNGTRAMAETLLVRSISGNTITFNRPLYYDYEVRYLPQLYQISASPVRNAGIEDLYIESAVGNTSGGGIIMSCCVYSWVKNVESYNIPYKHIELSWGAYGNEVRDSYFHHTQRYDGDHGYGMNIHNYATDNLAENNIFYYLHTGVVIGGAGGAGNVVGYNYFERTEHHQPNWFQYHIGSHGAHTYMNLWEGNVAGKLQFDCYWGSGSHSMVFRNRITRENPGQPVSLDIAAAIVDAHNYYMTFVGNIMGTVGCAGPTEQIPLLARWNNPVLWIIGFATGSGTGTPDDSKTAETLIRTGNWECSTNAIQWTSDERSIPDSLYLSSKPGWFGLLDWPPFTPERQGFNPADPKKIPAQVRFENGPALGLPLNTSRGF